MPAATITGIVSFIFCHFSQPKIDPQIRGLGHARENYKSSKSKTHRQGQTTQGLTTKDALMVTGYTTRLFTWRDLAQKDDEQWESFTSLLMCRQLRIRSAVNRIAFIEIRCFPILLERVLHCAFLEERLGQVEMCRGVSGIVAKRGAKFTNGAVHVLLHQQSFGQT